MQYYTQNIFLGNIYSLLVDISADWNMVANTENF